MQTKTMLKYHFSPIRLATILKSANTLSGKGVGKDVLSHIMGGNVNWHNSTKGSLAISVKFTNAQTYLAQQSHF